MQLHTRSHRVPPARPARLRHAATLSLVAMACAWAFAGCGHDDEEHGHAATGPICARLADQCHDATASAGVACHDLGHAADEAKCGAREAECLALCKSGAAGAGGGSGGAAGSAGSVGGSAGVGGGVGTTSVELRFSAKVGALPFSCAGTFTDLGTTKSTWTPKDFRLYVHDVALLQADGSAVPLALEQDGVWQVQNVALLDFEDKSGSCANGTTEVRTVVRGAIATVPTVGLRFRVGVPHALNHADAAAAPSPLNLTTMWWSWNEGYKFLRIDGATKALPSFLVHVGATACDPGNAPTKCGKPNSPEVTLQGFDPSKTVVADLAKLLEAVDLDTNTAMTAPGCMSGADDPECAGIFAALGLDPATGTAAAKAQTFFRVE